MSAHKTLIETPSDREIVFTRVFDAPRELVWAVYTDPQHVAQWWGPKGFTNTIHEMDVRPGGLWRLTMHGPDGTDWPNRIEFIEVVPLTRLVYHHGDDKNPRVFHVTKTFTVEGTGTKIVHRMLFPTPEECAARLKFAGDGYNSSMARLEEHLARQQTTEARTIVSTREFAESPEAVFAAFSDPSRLAQWWGPNGFTNTIHAFDLRPGGAWRLTMHGPNGANYDNHSEFIEVTPPTRVVFQHLEPVHSFRMTMDFVGKNGRMILTWRMCFDSADEFAKVGKFIVAANEQNFDRLAAHLAR